MPVTVSVRKGAFEPTELQITEDELGEAEEEVKHRPKSSSKATSRASSLKSSGKDVQSNIDTEGFSKMPCSSSPSCFRKRGTYIDQSPSHRTAMGKYIAPEGGRPLTAYEYETVGPAKYVMPSISLTKTHYPQYSILNRNIYNPRDLWKPGPNIYNLPDMMITKNRNFTLHKKLKTSKKVIAGPCKVGPAYCVKNFNIGKDSLKYSVPKARRDKVIPGPPNMLVKPEDTLGFKTPAAELFGETGILPHSYHTNFTSIPDTKYSDTPAPCEYELPQLDSGLKKSLGAAICPNFANDDPAPNQYIIGTRIGEGPAYSITLPAPPIQPFRVPSPCAYMREREYDHKEKVQIAQRCPSPPLERRPGPRTYNIVGDMDKPKPSPSIKSRNRVPYPSSLWSVDCDVGKSPGPATHDLRRDTDRLDKGATLKKPFVHLYPGCFPGPSDHGRIEVDPLSTITRAPAYSMRPQRKLRKPRAIPGPAAYKTVPLDSGPQFTFKGRHPQRKKHPAPAPNTYIPKQGCTRIGAREAMGCTLSSRHSPWKYTGMKQVA